MSATWRAARPRRLTQTRCFMHPQLDSQPHLGLPSQLFASAFASHLISHLDGFLFDFCSYIMAACNCSSMQQ